MAVEINAHPPDEYGIEPLANVDDIRIGNMLDNPPPERRWLLNDLMPLGVVGLLAAGGGTGKSFLTIQMAIAITTGRPFLGIEIGEPGGVLIVAAEDERDELHRRLWRIVNRLRNDGELTEIDIERLRERLFMVSCVGVDNRLTADLDRQIIRTYRDKSISALVDQLPDIKLIVLDPVSRFRGGDENSNDAATRFVEAVETLRADTGATVLLPHHVSKNGLSAGAEALSVEALRGASALVDGVRWAAAMATLKKDAAEDYGIDREEHGRYVRLDAVKNNYAPPWPGLWLERQKGGVLAPTELELSKDARKQQQADDRYREVLNKVKNRVRQMQETGEPLTMRGLRGYAGRAGIFGVGRPALEAIVRRAIDEGHIAEHTPEGGKHAVLRTWK